MKTQRGQDVTSNRQNTGSLEAGIGKQTLVGSVQRKEAGPGPSDPSEVGRLAAGGLGSGGALPHRDQLERGYGVDLGGVKAHTGAGAAQANQAIGAQAYTMGSDIAFATPSPSVQLAAHEVAHVIQQKAGAGPASGVGQEGDAFEQEADAASETVARGGKSDLASRYAPSGGTGAVQAKSVQRDGPTDEQKLSQLRSIALGAIDIYQTAAEAGLTDAANDVQPSNWHGWGMSLAGNIIWAAASFYTGGTAFIISLSGIALGAIGTIPNSEPAFVAWAKANYIDKIVDHCKANVDRVTRDVVTTLANQPWEDNRVRRAILERLLTPSCIETIIFPPSLKTGINFITIASGWWP